ncbi:MAG: PAS domain S-box protein, partial [Prolixibacteraceae bacterium]|nr:PAS domain S-box protein [Prolixibacteraceae bacterium]
MKRIYIILIITFLVLLVSAFWVGHLYSNKIKESALQGVEKELHSIARIKTDNFKIWYDDELNDAHLIALNPALVSAISEWQKSQTEEKLLAVKGILSAISTEHSLSNVTLYTPEGTLVVSNNSLTPKALQDSLILKAVKQRETVISGLYRSHIGRDVLLSFIGPVLSPQGQPVAAILLTFNLTEDYFPAFDKWPGNEETGQILLVEKTGDSIRFFNQKTPVAPNNIVPTHNMWKNIITTSNSHDLLDGIFTLPNLSVTPAISYVNRVSGTPYFIIATLHQREVFSESKLKTTYFYTIFGIVIVLILIIIAFFHRASERNYFKRMFIEHEAYKTTLYSIGDGVIITDMNGTVKNLNKVAEQITGWNESEARERNIEEVFEIVNENTFDKVDNPVEKVLEQGVIVGLANHTILISREGEQIPIADSG